MGLEAVCASPDGLLSPVMCMDVSRVSLPEHRLISLEGFWTHSVFSHQGKKKKNKKPFPEGCPPNFSQALHQKRLGRVKTPTPSLPAILLCPIACKLAPARGRGTSCLPKVCPGFHPRDRSPPSPAPSGFLPPSCPCSGRQPQWALVPNLLAFQS